MKIQTYSYSNNGGKKNNDDFCLGGDTLWLTANGAGRNGTGRSVSAAALSLFFSAWKENGSPTEEKALQRIVNAVGDRLSAQPDQASGAYQAGISMAAVVAAGPTFRFFSVGNTRAYFFKDGRIRDHTEDDSVSGALCAAGFLPFEDIRTHSGRRLLLRSMEATGGLQDGVVIRSAAAAPGDAFLLCTDGFWEQVYEMEMEIDLSKSADPKQWMHYMAKRILLKKKTETCDCFSATCIMVGD